MFESRARDIIVPQAEHAKLAGVVARLWGNSEFQKPNVDFESFTLGVDLHDRCYGEMDNYPIGRLSDEVWVPLERDYGVEPALDDPAATMLIRLHIKRLAQIRSTPERIALAKEIDEKVNAAAKKYSLNRDDFERADRIMDFCDSLAFDFSFEMPTRRAIEVYADPNAATPVKLEYYIKANGVIELEPWPLSVPEYSGNIVGYEAQGYPDNPVPTIMPFTLRPLSSK